MNIGLAYDLKEHICTANSQAGDEFEEYDSPETVDLIADTLKTQGHTITLLGGGREFIENILAHRVDMVFNIAEGRGNNRSREAQVPSVLEMLGIPYSGSDPQCLAICLDKPLTKQLVAAAGVRTPRCQVISSHVDIERISDMNLSYPAILKPAFEGSSKGICGTSVVEDSLSAIETAEHLLKTYRQPVMLEEFIDGHEVTIGITGNSPARVLEIMRILPRQESRHFIYSLEVKRNYVEMVDYECPAILPQEIRRNLEQDALKAFTVLGCRDFARLDFRISPDGTAHFIEINALPGLGTYSDLVIMAQKTGWTHRQLILDVFNSALKRYPQCVAA